jgi:hypothetical protein
VPLEEKVRTVSTPLQVGAGGALHAVLLEGYVHEPPPQVPGAL